MPIFVSVTRCICLSSESNWCLRCLFIVFFYRFFEVDYTRMLLRIIDKNERFYSTFFYY